MKKNTFGESKAHRFFSGKGFYVTLAVSLVAVGGAAWLGVNSAINQLGTKEPEPNNITSQIEENNEWDIPPEHEVTAPQSGIEAKTEEPKAPVSSEAEANSAVEQGCILPLKGDVLNAYSGDKVVKSKTLDDWVMHTGVDIAADVSTPVKAMSAGKVTDITNDSMWGTTVTIEHANGLSSYYANLKSAVSVKVGQQVKMGTVIGAVGESADIEHAELPHLHFGVKQDGEWVDPLSIAK